MFQEVLVSGRVTVDVRTRLSQIIQTPHCLLSQLFMVIESNPYHTHNVLSLNTALITEFTLSRPYIGTSSQTLCCSAHL